MIKLIKRLYDDITTSRHVISNFVNQALTVKYKRSALGFLWSLLNPMATMIISSIVFGSIMRFKLQDFVVFLYAGMLPWGFFGSSVDQCGISILNNEGFIKKIYIPKIVFPLSTSLALFINMLFSMVALFLFMIVLGAKITPALLFLPIAFLILFMWTFGISLFVAAINVYFRDMQYIMGVVLNAWYYITPILYPMDVIPENLQMLFRINPAYYIVDMFRAPIYYNCLPSMTHFLIATVCSVIVFFVGLSYFYAKEHDFVYRL